MIDPVTIQSNGRTRVGDRGIWLDGKISIHRKVPGHREIGGNCSANNDIFTNRSYIDLGLIDACKIRIAQNGIFGYVGHTIGPV